MIKISDKKLESWLHRHAALLVVSLLAIVLGMLQVYNYFNSNTNPLNPEVLPGKDIEDDFVLPPQMDEKYLYFEEDNIITVINYFSLDCPYCRKLFFDEKKFVEQYGNRVNFAFRDKPLSSNPLSYEKALIKECIYINNGNSNEKYFQFSEDVFTNYENKGNNLRDNQWVMKIALKYVDQETLNICLNDEKLKQKILGFRMSADASQIVWTPTIVVFKDGTEVERIPKVWGAIYKKVLEKYAN